MVLQSAHRLSLATRDGRSGRAWRLGDPSPRLHCTAVLIALNASLRRDRRRLRLVLATLVLGLVVLVAHGALAGGHMAWPAAGQTTMAGGHAMSGEGTTNGGVAGASGSVDALMAMCLAIAETAGLGARAGTSRRAGSARAATGPVAAPGLSTVTVARDREPLHARSHLTYLKEHS